MQALAFNTTLPLPRIFQGGMGVGVSSWQLARAVALVGQGITAGIVSNTLIGHTAARRLADKNTHWMRALAVFGEIIPEAAKILMDTYWDKKGTRIAIPLYHVNGKAEVQAKRAWLNIFGAFANVFLAAEGHAFPIGVNVLEKVQQPHLETFMGVLLAMTLRPKGALTFIIAGAGLPWQFPRALASLAASQHATYKIDIERETIAQDGTRTTKSDARDLVFDLNVLTMGFGAETRKRLEGLPLSSPPVIGIVSTLLAAKVLERKSQGAISGYVVEHYSAAGHNAPPRRSGEYGKEDEMDFTQLRSLLNTKPFWIAGGYGSPHDRKIAEILGVVGVQCGSIFAPCAESGFTPDIKRIIIDAAKARSLSVRNDRRASPTGFPFMVSELPGTAGIADIDRQWERSCDIGHLRTEVWVNDERVGRESVIYRCPAEPEHAFVAKGGAIEETVGRMCLCRRLFGAAGNEHLERPNHIDVSVVTLGLHAPEQIKAFLDEMTVNMPEEYTARKVVEYLLRE